MTYTEALEYLVSLSGWPREDVLADGTSAAWFCAQRATTTQEARDVQAAGVIVARGKK